MEQADADLDTAIDTALDTYDEAPPATETEAPKAEEAEPAPADTPPPEDEAQPRNEDGTYASPKDVEAQPEGAPETPEGEVEPTGEGDADTAPEADVEPEPFVFRADGTDFEVPGSAVSEKDGLYIPPDQVETVTQLLRFGKTYQGSFREELAASKDEVKAAGVERDAAQAARTTLLEKLASFEGQPEAFEQFMTEFHRELPMLLANARTAEAEALRQSDKDKLAELERERDFDRSLGTREDRLEEAIKYYGEAHGVDLEGMRTLWTRLRAKDQMDRIFTRSDTGEWAEDLGLVENEVRYLAAAIGDRALKEVEPQRKEAKANQKALDALKGKGRKPPPTAPTKKGPAPAAVPKPPEFETTEQADEWFEGGGYNQHFE